LTPRREPVLEQLKRRREQIVKQLDQMDKAIALLTEQPKLVETLDVLRSVGI